MRRFSASAEVASWSGYVRFHGRRPIPRENQIYVANHTSLIDAFVQVKDYNFSFIGQGQGGLAGLLADLLHTAQDHVWLDREERRDRCTVHKLLMDHVWMLVFQKVLVQIVILASCLRREALS